MSIPNVNEMFDRLNQEHFNGEVPKIPVEWNNRLRTTAGRCHSRWTNRRRREMEPTKIDLSNQLFASNGWNQEEVERTLIHEMVHAYLMHKYNNATHDWQFQSTMTRITGEWKNHRCHNYETAAVQNTRNIEVVCPVHGVVGHRARMPKAGLRYTHRNCGEHLTFTRNAVKGVKKMGKSVGFSLGGD